MAEEKGIITESFQVEVDSVLHIMNVSQVIHLIETAPTHEKKHIKDTFSKIDYHNGDLMHYIKFLAKAYIKTQFSQ